MKGFLGVFIFALITYLAVGTISAEIDSSAARSYMDDAKKEIAEANMASSVIDAVGAQAVKEGYQMKITAYGREGASSVDYRVGVYTILFVELFMHPIHNFFV